MKENEYSPEFEKIYTDMTKKELKPMTYLGYLQTCRILNRLRQAICEAKKIDKKDM